MGYNTPILILNDGWDQCRKYPDEFVDAVNEYVMGVSHPRGGVGNHANVVGGLRTAHADLARVIVSHGNLMLEMSPYNEDTLNLARRSDFGRDEVLRRISQARRHLDELEKMIK